MPTLFQTEILNSHSICSNCFGRRRREATRTTKWDGDQHYFERTDQLTTEFVPDVAAANARRVFCRCGADSAYSRSWDDADILADRSQFRDLLKTLVATLEKIACTDVDHKQAFVAALRTYNDIPDPGMHGPFREERPRTINEAFAAGVDAGVHRTCRSATQLSSHA